MAVKIKKYKIKFNNGGIIDNIKKFTNLASLAENDVYINAGTNFKQYRINGKSMLGLFSIDLTNIVVLEVSGDDAGRLLTELKLNDVCDILED